MTPRRVAANSATVRNSTGGRLLVKREAARARVVLDKKLGKKTPNEIVELSRRTTQTS